MNPDTGKFEALTPADPEQAKQLKEIEDRLRAYQSEALLRPDGSPAPHHWTILTAGELVEVKGCTLKVAHVGESHVLLEPVRLDRAVAEALEGE